MCYALLRVKRKDTHVAKVIQCDSPDETRMKIAQQEADEEVLSITIFLNDRTITRTENWLTQPYTSTSTAVPPAAPQPALEEVPPA